MIVLCLNGGSSTLKAALFDGERRIASRSIEGTGAAALHGVMDALDAEGLPRPDAVAHRLVHGGPSHHEPAVLDDSLVAALREAVPFAPLHLPSELAAVDAVRSRHPALPQVACFDTHFHWDMPQAARTLPLPRAIRDAGIRRYGFHGLSYEWVVASVGRDRLGRAVLAHLGNGASLCAVRDGRSIDTTMGFTPTGGIPMGTRTGDLDPGVLVHLLDAKGYGARELERLVDRESGLLGVSGRTSDMKSLLQARAHDSGAALAVELFCYSARKAIGAFAAALGGLDTLVFTGGIGENAPAVRAEICAGLAHLGIAIDAARNESSETIVSEGARGCTVRVVRADEERMLCRHAHQLLADRVASAKALR